jgi:D-sedoheptulose 7-phosphate isomerase
VKNILDVLIQRYPLLEPVKKELEDMYRLMEETYENKGKMLVAGNGGSAADAEHIVGELMKSFKNPRKVNEEMMYTLAKIDSEKGKWIGENLQGALPAIAVVDHVALSTAYLNDVNPLMGMAQQVYGYGNSGDIFLGISTSGNSDNILYAATVAKAKGLKVAALSGGTGGKLKEIADVSVIVPETETYKIQEFHLPIYHALCLMLEERFFGAE